VAARCRKQLYRRNNRNMISVIDREFRLPIVQRDWSTQEYSGSACCRRDGAKG